MKIIKIIAMAVLALSFTASCAQQQSGKKENGEIFSEFPSVIKKVADYNALTQFETYVIEQEGTERAFTGQFNGLKKEGTFICKRCNNPLFHSSDKFNSRSGWPSFDDMIAKNVIEKTDADGYRTEIECGNCGAHLGHVFKGEGFTSKNTRHCVNSASMNFVTKKYEQ